MITKKTTLVLGAGASMHCGYPLGQELINKICGSKSYVLPKWPFEINTAEFIHRMSRAGHYSIDAFLEGEAEEFRKFGKFLIAQELKKCETPDRLFPPHDPGWYQHLFNRMSDGGLDRFGDNKLSIITFNYDRSLEYYLHTVIQNRYKVSEDVAAAALRQIPIVHVHGIMGVYPDIPYQPAEWRDVLQTVADSIKIIHEITDAESGFCSPEFEQANALLEAADHVYFLGFGFHPDNVRRLKLRPEMMERKDVAATLHGLGPVDRRRVLESLIPFGLMEGFNFTADGNQCGQFFSHCKGLE